MKDIFGNEIVIKKNNNDFVINGLIYKKDWITEQEETELLFIIDNIEWQTDLKRRVQHYGYIYDYKSAKAFVHSNKDNYIGELPNFLKIIAKRLVEENFFEEEPDQVIINEYLPGQGIADHIDCIPCFNDTVVSISLGSDCVMDFKNNEKQIYKNKVLHRRSLLCIKDEARYEWSHGIRKNKTDIINYKRVKRGRRVSVTFRKVI